MPATASRSTKPKAAAPASKPPAKSGGITLIKIGTAAEKKPAKGKTEYPHFEDEEATQLAHDILQEQADWEALDGSLKAKKGELRSRAAAFYFSHNSGKVTIPSSVECGDDDGKLLVTLPNKYRDIAIEAQPDLIALLGEEFVTANFRARLSLKIDGDLLPSDNAQEIVDKLLEVLAEYNCSEALTAKQVIRPNTEFHTARHRLLTIDQNEALQLIMPIEAMVKTKGRGE